MVELFRAIIHESRRIQTRATAQSSEEQTVHRLDRNQVSVAFQGAPGAFSEDAAVKLLGQEIVLVPRPTFESLFQATDDGSAEYVLAPIENSLAGFVQPSFDHLLDSRLFIIGEVIIPIAHCLIVCQGSSFEMIAAVESHPVALDQCRRFLAANPQIKRIAAEDTAGSVARVIAQGDLTRAASIWRTAGRTSHAFSCFHRPKIFLKTPINSRSSSNCRISQVRCTARSSLSRAAELTCSRSKAGQLKAGRGNTVSFWTCEVQRAMRKLSIR